MKNISTMKLIGLILLLFPVFSLFGAILYVMDMLKGNWTKLEVIVIILSIPFGILASFLLWLKALGIVKF